MDTTRIDIDRYLERIAYDGPTPPTVATLEALHLAHATHIPFENLDIFLGRPIRLDLASVEAKLVSDRRGGYCFEQNALFAAVLEALGFRVTRLAGRVRYGTDRVLPRTHMTLKVDVQGESVIADVGFGGEGLLLPVPLAIGRLVTQFAWAYRLIEEADVMVLQSERRGQWQNLYAFSLEPQLAVDYEVANYYVSTHPNSRFVQTLSVQLPGPEARHLLIGDQYSVDYGNVVKTHEIKDDNERLDLLERVFGLRFAADTEFRSPNA